MADTALRVARRPREFVGVRGPDSASYLQAMVSNDVEALGPGEACEALLLTSKARVIAPLRVLRRGIDDFLLFTEPGLGDRVRSVLLRAFAAV
jgi:folate-binding Fe-S cluster repair protein YgfZ